VPDAGAVATRAILISFAGLDGAGKTTQAGLLADWLAALASAFFEYGTGSTTPSSNIALTLPGNMLA